MKIQNQSFDYLDEYKIIKMLGSGFNAKVLLGQDEHNNLVAIKQYKRQTSSLQDLIHELNIMKQFNHENIVKLISVRKDAVYKYKNQNQDKCFAIILEYIGGGQLFDFIAQTGNFSSKVARTYFHQLINGLNYIHSKGYAHRDIKPENLLISKDFSLKIADFGFSCSLKGHEGNGVLTTRLGTQGYMAPQIYQKNYDGKRCDIFAAGVILFIMYSGSPPFTNASFSDPYYKLIREKDYGYFWAAHSRKRSFGFFTQDFKNLFERLIAYQPSQRLTIQQIIQDKWINKSICTSSQIFAQFSQRQEILNKKMQQKKIQIKKQSEQKISQIESQGESQRGGQNVSQQYLQHYNKQYLHPRTLKSTPQQQSPYAFATQKDIPMAICDLKQYIKSKTYSLIEQQESQWLDNMDMLRTKSIQDNHKDQIIITYQYSYQVKDQIYVDIIKISIRFTLNKYHKLIISFDQIQGHHFYFKKIFYDIKKQCFGL